MAHFLDRILFCLFAEDAGLLPRKILERLSMASHGRADVFSKALGELFAKMSEAGGLFGTDEIDWFNGGLFDSPDAHASVVDFRLRGCGPAIATRRPPG